MICCLRGNAGGVCPAAWLVANCHGGHLIPVQLGFNLRAVADNTLVLVPGTGQHKSFVETQSRPACKAIDGALSDASLRYVGSATGIADLLC
jgi:hypothetical protein